jgi:hypothetical protein
MLSFPNESVPNTVDDVLAIERRQQGKQTNALNVLNLEDNYL